MTVHCFPGPTDPLPGRQVSAEERPDALTSQRMGDAPARWMRHRSQEHDPGTALVLLQNGCQPEQLFRRVRTG